MTCEYALIDTHTAVWLYQRKRDKIGGRALAIIEDGKAQLNLPAFVYLELQYLYEIERITATATDIASELASTFGITPTPKSSAGELVTKALPLAWTRDVFDRLIAAEVSLTNATLLTKDKSLTNQVPNCVWD